jgi:L-lactate permease
MRVVVALLPVLITIGSIVLLNAHIVRACSYGLFAAIAIASIQFGFPAQRIAGHLVHGILSSWDLVLLVAGGSPLRPGSLAVIAGAAVAGAVAGGLIGPAFPTMLGGLAAALASMALQGKRSLLEQLGAIPAKGLLPIAVVAVGMRVAQVGAFARQLSWTVETQVGSVIFAVGSSSGAALLAASLIGLARCGRAEVETGLRVVGRGRAAMVVAPIAMSMAGIMSSTGMIAEIAQSSAVLGRLPFAFFLPPIGMLGHYVTGSTISGNLVIGGYVAETARTLGLSPSLAAAIALVGGASGIVIIPSKTAIASAAINYLGGQKAVVQRGLLAAAVSSLALTLVMLILGGR